ncbi:MAG: NADH-quinone oxidoreductase subunit J, partial [Planctomycetaceae bacterium]|nr:NADH-quinone oxidoreductase subunit J [Planctomycetaceae bacterium]
MMGATILFWILALTAAFGAIAVVVTQNVVRMAFWLIVSLGSTAGLFFLLNADFVGATQILVYVGGTVVLLIFGVMLTASGPYTRLKMSPGNLIVVGALGATFFFIVFLAIGNVNWDRSVLRQVAVSSDRFKAIRDSADEETQKLLDEKFESFSSSESGGITVHRLSPEAELSSDEQKLLPGLMQLYRKKGLTFSPSSKTGGTIRPLGFSFLG